MPTGNTKLIHNNDFCEIVTDKFAEADVKRGHVVFVAGHKALPEDETDPYTQRIKFLVHLVRDEHVLTDKIFIMDPRSLQKVASGKQKRLTKIFKQDFSEDSSN